MTTDQDWYLEKVAQRGNINIWVVDGKKIRTSLDREFNNFGQHYRFNCIPINEFWLDNEADLDERNFFIDHLLLEWKLMKEGKSYNEAIERADKKELIERARVGDLVKVLDKNGNISLEAVHKKILGTTEDGLTVWLVNGRLVRSDFFIDFTEGGHDCVYKFVSPNEIWIDDDISEEERPYVLLHELNERKLMHEKNLSYNEAHNDSSRIEWEARHDDKKLNESLEKLGWSSGK